MRLFEATQTTICERKEIFVAENENRDLNKPNQNQTGSNAGNPNNNHADQPQRAPRRRPMPRRNAARQTSEGEEQTANAAPRKPRMPRKPRAQQPQPVGQAADKPQEAAKPRRPRMPRKPMNQNPAPAANGEAQAAAQAPRAPKANTRTARPRATAAVGSTGNAPQIAAPQQAAKPMQPRRNPPRPRANSARPAERPQTGMRRRIVAPIAPEEKPCISQTLQWVGKKPPTMRSRASEHPSRATLRMIPLGGMCEIGKNMTAYEYGNDIIIVDCGQIFPDETMPGVDAVIPDFTYVLQNRDRVRGIFITHGHEDHIGGLPYLMREFRAPIYGGRMTIELLKYKLDDRVPGLTKSCELHVVEAGETIRSGCFSVEFIHANHSIADAVCFAIKCGVGTVVHTGDFKIDPTPIQGGMMDLGRLGQLGKEGVLALLADSTNVERPGYTRSESSVGNSFDVLFKGCEERIIVTTFASNVDRIQQIIDVAARYGRKVAVTGRSMENAMKVSTELGYMNIPDGVLVDLAHIKSLPKHKICIITTGSQGETMSALTRMAFNTHRQVEIQAGDRVILSASAIPGNENAIGSVINELYRKDAEVVNERLGALHVSGHACQEELKIIHALVKPKFFIPVHGEQRHLKTHAKLAQQMGMPPKNILISDIGKVIELTPNSAKINGTVPAGRVFVDGYGVGDVGSVVLRDRKHLAEDGMIVVVVSMSGEDGSVVSGPDIITRGFVYVKESEGLMEELRKVAVKALEECRMDTMNDWASIKSEIKNAISGFLYKKTKRNPMILPVIMEV